MSIKLIKPNKYETGFMHKRQEEFLLDSEDDLGLLPKDTVAGSVAYMSDMSKSWRLGVNKEWKEIADSASSLPSDPAPYQQLVTDENGAAMWVDGGYVKARITTDDIVWDKSSSTPGTNIKQFLNGAAGRYIKVSSYVPLKEDALSSDAVWSGVNADISYDFDGAYGVGSRAYASECVSTPDGNVPECMIVSKPFKLYVHASNGSDELYYFNFWEPGIYMFAKQTGTWTSKLSCLCNVPMGDVAVPFVQSASVGQTVVVKAVDENGKPTEWEPVDMQSGGGVAFIALNKPTPVVWDASSNQYVELTKDRFIELFNNGVVRVMDAGLGDPTKHSSGTGAALGTVVSYWINATVANVGVSGTGTNGYYFGSVAGWV